MMTATQVDDFDTECGISVKPDVLSIAIAARVEDELAVPALAALQCAAESLDTTLTAIAEGARLAAGRLDFGAASTEKAARAGRSDVVFHGTALVPLGDDDGIWERAELAARIVEALGEGARELAKGKPKVLLHWKNPVGRLGTPDQHRPALAKRWNEQWRALTEGSTAHAPATWEMPEQVIVVPVSLAEVRVALGPSRIVRR